MSATIQAVPRVSSSAEIPERILLAGLGLTSFAALLLELALTRLFSVVLFYHFAFLAISIALWSGFTAACGLATNFLQLFLTRVGVGIGPVQGSRPAAGRGPFERDQRQQRRLAPLELVHAAIAARELRCPGQLQPRRPSRLTRACSAARASSSERSGPSLIAPGTP